MTPAVPPQGPPRESCLFRAPAARRWTSWELGQTPRQGLLPKRSGPGHALHAPPARSYFSSISSAVMPYLLQYCLAPAHRCRPGRGRRTAGPAGLPTAPRRRVNQERTGDPAGGAGRRGRPEQRQSPAGDGAGGNLGGVRSSVPRPPSRSPAATAAPQPGPAGEVRPRPGSPQFRCAYRPPARCPCLAVIRRALAYCLDDES
jgi:hypothetical protein